MLNVPWNPKKSLPSTHYINKDDMAEEVEKSIANNRTATEKLGKMWLEIIDHMMHKKNFRYYCSAWQGHMRDFAILKLTKSMKTVDLSKCQNIFNYYSRVVYLAFVTELQRQKRISKTITLKEGTEQ